MKSQVRNTLITVCAAGAISTTVAPLTTPPPEEWKAPLATATIVLSLAGMAVIQTKED